MKDTRATYRHQGLKMIPVERGWKEIFEGEKATLFKKGEEKLWHPNSVPFDINGLGELNYVTEWFLKKNPTLKRA